MSGRRKCTLMLLLLSDVLMTSSSRCLVDKCMVPDERTLSETCAQTVVFVECLNVTIVQNDQCDDDLRLAWRGTIEAITATLVENRCQNNYSHARFDHLTYVYLGLTLTILLLTTM
ncbi:unnamed protein product [Lymnaea stagnalis]|uniref:Uncharacterized protein n=1 Tax=Lymnaea stagnalis TaxID=6523 RepID=A0AAV2HIQ7_LYMST